MRQRSVHWLFAVVGASTLALGSGASAQPVPPPPGNAGATRPADAPERPERPRYWLGREEQPTPEEWEAIAAFMAQNNPIRLELLKRIEDSLGDKEHVVPRQVRRAMTRRFRELENLKNRSPNVYYPYALTRLQLEDNILGTMRDLKAPDAKKDVLGAKLNEQIRASVDNSLAERRTRIEQLAAALEREKNSLAKDTSEIDRLVTQQREKFEKEMSPMLDFDAQAAPATTQASDSK